MQVADIIAPPVRVEAGRAILSARAEYLSVSVKTTLSVPSAEQASEAALWAMKYIADSTRLSPSEKQTLTRLVAVVDHFANGDPKLMRDVIGIAKVMEAKAEEGTYRRHTMREIMDAYWEERAALSAEDAVQVSAETEIRIVQMDLNITIETAE